MSKPSELDTIAVSAAVGKAMAIQVAVANPLTRALTLEAAYSCKVLCVDSHPRCSFFSCASQGLEFKLN